MTNLSVRVVEDEIDGQEVVASILRYHNIHTDIAGDAEAAINLLSTNHYNCAVVDLSLPGLSGWDLLNIIQNSGASMPCVAVTAFHSSDVAMKAIQAGFKAYFPKPIDPTSFVRQLEYYFA